MDNGRARARLRLEPRASCVAQARRLVRRTLTNAGRDDLVDAAELATSELVTNALVHAGTYIDLTVVVSTDSVRVEIADGSPHLPEPREYGPAAGTGRGLVMVEQMVDDWGVSRLGPRGPGKVVWFEIGARDLTDEEQVSANVASERRGEVVEVHLVDVPLLLHAAWQQHVQALLREYLLATLDRDTAEDAVQVHAEASDALALLAEHLPRPDLGDRPEHMLEVAGDPDRSNADVTVPVPVDSVAHFAALDRALDHAITAANSGQMLTPPTQPELRGLRRWICRQVEQQSTGAPPEAWTPAEAAPVAGTVPPTWDAAPVAGAAEALVAADDSDMIVAVSEAAAVLLGYDAPAELVGRRVVSLIPARYRQAHLAGFTLHLYAGRRPLLDQPTTVPVLCRDGTELMVRLTVRAVELPGERAVFTAALDPAAG